MIVTGIPLLNALFAHSYYALQEAPWPHVQVEGITITGLNHLERRDVLNTLGVPRHANFLSLHLPQLARRLESLPWLRSAVVRLDPPGRIFVEVIEREPLAIVHTGELFLLDTEGKLFSPARVDKHPGLLLVTGFSGSDLRKGEFLASKPLATLKQLISALDKVQDWLPIHQISECHWHNEKGFVLYTAQRSIPIRLGWEDFDGKLTRLQSILGMLKDRRCLDLVTGIDLDYQGRAYVEGTFPAPKGI